jgi:HAE1 family hydrophobic/amphiphilic exporter-1
MFHRFGEWFNALDASYRRGLAWGLHHRAVVIVGAFGSTLVIVGCFFILPMMHITVPLIGTEMMPTTDSGNFNITLKMPVGTALSETDKVVRKAEDIVLANPNVDTAFAASGTTLSMRGSTTQLEAYMGSLVVKLKDNRTQSTQDVINDLRKKLQQIPGLRSLLTQYDIVSNLMTGGNLNVEVDIFGQDLSTLSSLGSDMMARMRTVGGLENVDVNWVDAMPEIRWKVDREKAQKLGVAFSDVADTLYTATNGGSATRGTSYYQEGGFQYPIVVQIPESLRKNVSQMEDLVVSPKYPTATNEPIFLRQVATPIISTGPSEIWRQNRQRFIGITGMPQGRSSGEVQADIQKAISKMHLPDGYYWDWGVNQKRQAEEFSGMWLAVLLAICLIYMLLASQFESFIHPLTILLSVPLAATGVVLAIFLTGRSFGLTAFIGVLMLVGICVKNGILLVDYTNHLRREGMEREEALLRAGPTRLRPILMTASAAILGMLPIALALGRGAEVQAPMATAVIGGLTTSTLLTLFVVPAVYSTLDDLGEHLKRRKSGS